MNTTRRLLTPPGSSGTQSFYERPGTDGPPAIYTVTAPGVVDAIGSDNSGGWIPIGASGTAAQRPSAPAAGAGSLYWDVTNGTLLVSDGQSWRLALNGAASGFFAGGALSGATGSRPANPAAGQVYFDTTLSAFVVYDGANWRNSSGAVS